jgi:O-antigen/teichoic acid export membrane protein
LSVHPPSNSSVSSPSGLTASVGKSAAWGIISSLFQVGTRFVTVPVIIYHLGLGGYGIWSIIMTAAIYMRFGSVGIKGAFQKYVAESTGDGNYRRAGELLSTGTAGIVILSVAGLIPVIVLSRQLASVAGVPQEFLTDTARALSVFGLTMLFANSGAAYEAIVLGGHRIDLTRKASTILTVAEAISIVALLHFGFGLFSMACVMAISELVYLIYCYAAARHVARQVRVTFKLVTRKVLREVLRFAGSYQLLSVLQLTYAALVPVVVLRTYGADAAGVYAVANRLVQPVTMCHNALLLPILSSGAMVYATGASERLKRLLAKSLKVTLAMTIAPLTLISTFGVYVVQAWTGQADPAFHYAISLVCLALLFQTLSQLGLVLYRAAGGAVVDNIREMVRLLAFVPAALMSHQFGFKGVLAWMAGAEFVGMLVMFSALRNSLYVFDLKLLLSDALRLSAATLGMVAFAATAAYLIPEPASNLRMGAITRVAVAGVAALGAAYPALRMTSAITKSEMRSALQLFRRRGVGLAIE